MADMITRCPKCATAFRISDSLLKSAKGVVRCGSCLSVFNAREHLEYQPEHAAPGTTAINARPQTSPKNLQHQYVHPDPISEAPPANVRPQAPDQSSDGEIKRAPRNFPHYFDKDSGSSLFNRKLDLPENDNFEDNESDDDEAWALALLNDDTDSNIQLKKITTASPTVQSTSAEVGASNPLDSLDDIDIDANKLPPENFLEDDLPPLDHKVAPRSPSAHHAASASQRTETTPTAGGDEDTPNELSNIGESMSSGVVHKAKVGEDGTPQHGQTSVADQPQNNGSTPSVPAANKTAKPKAKHNSALHKYNARQAARNSNPPSIKDVIANLEPEPLEVPWDDGSKLWRKRLLWPSLAILALMLLVVQIAWLEFHRLNRTEPYRAVYALACEILGCELPELLDRSQIKTSNLLVRSHPDIENALMVDVILQNNADFEQSFPSLLLTFTDIKNQAVASRKLGPNEYLGGELSGHKTMPSKQPIHIGLEIVDPGQDAVSYSIAIVD